MELRLCSLDIPRKKYIGRNWFADSTVSRLLHNTQIYDYLKDYDWSAIVKAIHAAKNQRFMCFKTVAYDLYACRTRERSPLGHLVKKTIFNKRAYTAAYHKWEELEPWKANAAVRADIRAYFESQPPRSNSEKRYRVLTNKMKCNHKSVDMYSTIINVYKREVISPYNWNEKSYIEDVVPDYAIKKNKKGQLMYGSSPVRSKCIICDKYFD
jgi:hypothetical protein